MFPAKLERTLDNSVTRLTDWKSQEKILIISVDDIFNLTMNHEDYISSTCTIRETFLFILEKKKLYVYSIAKNSDKTTRCFSNYTECILNDTPPPIQCPPGYAAIRDVSTCGSTTEVFSYQFVLPCNNWHTCAQKVYGKTHGCSSRTRQLIRYTAIECEESKLITSFDYYTVQSFHETFQ